MSNRIQEGSSPPGEQDRGEDQRNRLQARERESSFGEATWARDAPLYGSVHIGSGPREIKLGTSEQIPTESKSDFPILQGGEYVT